MSAQETPLWEPVPLWRIKPSRWQPRSAKMNEEKLVELAHSIKDNGLINPVRIFAYDDEEGYIVYELIAGERRTRASVAIALAEAFPQHSLDDWARRLAMVGLDGMGDEERKALHKAGAMILATLDTGDMTARHILAVIENLDRDDLNALEEARAYQGLIEAYGWSQREAAARVNKSQGYIAQRLGLLALNEQAAEALNTRVIGLTHARAIAAVPETLQAVTTEYVTAELKKDESPATTRQIENQLRALTAFVNPERWEPNGEHVYTPQQRNRLAVIRMLVSGPHAEDRIAKAWGHLRTYKGNYYSDKNLLTAKPLTLVSDNGLYGAVTNALGMRPEDAWQNHAHLEKKSCRTCIFGPVQRPATPDLAAHCPRWLKKNSDMQTCQNWIGGSDPVVIQIGEYYIRNRFGDGEALPADRLHKEPFTYVDDLDMYLTAYEAATQYLIQEAVEREDRVSNQHRRDIEAFYRWQSALPEAHLRHSQAHRCEACRYFEPLNGDAPCRFALNPVGENYSGPRAPQFGVLAGPTGVLLPRCEMFTLRELPRVFQQPGFSVAKTSRRSMMEWMRAIKKGSSFSGYRSRMYLWRGPFAWLYPSGDHNNKPTSYNWDDIGSYLHKHWNEIGDGGMATLIDALIVEAKAASTYGDAPIELLDLDTYTTNLWMPIEFDKRNEEQRPWPEGWVRPWMQKTLVEVFDEAGLLDDGEETDSESEMQWAEGALIGQIEAVEMPSTLRI